VFTASIFLHHKAMESHGLLLYSMGKDKEEHFWEPFFVHVGINFIRDHGRGECSYLLHHQFNGVNR